MTISLTQGKVGMKETSFEKPSIFNASVKTTIMLLYFCVATPIICLPQKKYNATKCNNLVERREK